MNGYRIGDRAPDFSGYDQYMKIRKLSNNVGSWVLVDLFTPANEDYRFTNLIANPITLLGGSVSAATPRFSAQFVAGRTTAWRNIFGTDSDALGQELAQRQVDGAQELRRPGIDHRYRGVVLIGNVELRRERGRRGQ